MKKELVRRCRCFLTAATRSSREEVQQPADPLEVARPSLNLSSVVHFKSKKHTRSSSSGSNPAPESSSDIAGADALAMVEISRELAIAFDPTRDSLDTNHRSNSRLNASRGKKKSNKKIPGKSGKKV